MLQHICKSSVVTPYVNGNDTDKYRMVTNLIQIHTLHSLQFFIY